MQQVKKVGAIAIFILLLACIVAGCLMWRSWPIRFKAELDKFFGKDNWECISRETKESIIYSEYTRSDFSREVPGKYTNWHISFTKRNGEEETWYITNHVLKINHDKYGIFSSKRYSNKQALTLELMDISFGVIGDEVYEEIIRSQLSEEEAACFSATISYHGGNPKPDFYDALAKEEWFTVNEVSAENYLAYDRHDFYLYIRAYDYKLEKLTEEQLQNVWDSMEVMEQKLLEKYGENASFEIYIDEEHKVEYVDGELMTK